MDGEVRIVLKETSLGKAQWSVENIAIGATDQYDGRKNMNVVKSISGWQSLYPAFAVVDAHETAKGYTAAQIESLNDKGLITSEIYYTDYLKRDGNKWKITATDVRSELVSLKYGEAKNMPVEITAPECIASGTDYEVTLNTSAPLESFLVGSIVNEPIEFPVSQTRDVFRTIKSDELIRVLTSNSDNKNEYATVTIAVTRAKLEPPSVVINMTGMAFVMKRINVIKVNDQIKLEEINFNDKSET